MSDNTLENLMTEKNDMDNTAISTEENETTLVEGPTIEEVITTEEEVTTKEIIEKQPTEAVETQEPNIEGKAEEIPAIAEEQVAEEVVVEEKQDSEPIVEEQPAKEDITTEEEITKEGLETKTEETLVEEKPTFEETPALAKEQATEEVVTTEAIEKEKTTAEEVYALPEEQVAEEIVATEELTTENSVEEVPILIEKQSMEKEETTVTTIEEKTTEEEVTTEEVPKKQPFKLTPPENNEELFEKMCVKRGRKLIYAPKEVIYDASFTVLGTNKKNEEGIRIKDILEAEIKEGTRLGYLDKYDGLKSSEIKEEYENDIIYEYAEQEFKKMGVIFDGKKLKVYVYDWDGKACHHVGFLDETAAADSIKYFSDKENYSFDLCGIITGGKGKRVTKNENGKLTITKEKGGDYGIELDISVIARKD